MKLVIAVTVLFASCLSPLTLLSDDKCPASAQAVPLCTVLADAARYDGKAITLRRIYRMVIHGSVLMSPACSRILVNMRGASGEKPNKRALAVIRSLTKKDQFHPVDEVLSGNFRVAHEGQCFGQNCLSYEIEEVELLCAAPVKPAPLAQTGQSSQEKETQVPARPADIIVPLPSIKSVTADQAAGKKLFVQKCSVCHLPELPSYTAYGPLLDGKVVASRGDAAIREQIMRGSTRMPGWQYTMSSAEIEQIIGYLKTLDFSKRE